MFLHQCGCWAEQLYRPSIKPLKPEEIKQIREEVNVSQSVFAACLNTSLWTLQLWESGKRHPSGAALKLLHVVQKHGIKVVL